MSGLKIESNNLINMNLKPDTISSNVFQQLKDDENLLFISKDTKKAIESYDISEDDVKIKGRDRDKAKLLWKELLIDAICILKINDERESLFKSTKQIFKDDKEKMSLIKI